MFLSVYDHTVVLYALVSIGVAALTVVFLRKTRALQLGDEHRIPSPPSQYPIIGHMLQFLRPDYHRLLLNFADQLGPVYRIK